MRRIPIVLALLTMALPTDVMTQVTHSAAAIEEVRLADGSVLYGTVERDGNPLRLRLLSGDVVELSSERVASRKPARGRVVRGEFWREDPNQTRLFFGPTARGMERGKAYVAGFELVFPFIGFAITDDLILAGGWPFWGVFDEPVYWLAPKLRVSDGVSTDIAVGVLVFSVPDESYGVLYGVSTWGPPHRSFSAGVGYGFHDGELGGRPAIMAGMDVQAGPGFKLLSENYLFPGGVGLLSCGVRFFGEKLSADLGIGRVVGSDHGGGGFPIVNFVYAW